MKKIPLSVMIWGATAIVSLIVLFTTVKLNANTSTAKIEVIEPLVNKHEVEIQVLKTQSANMSKDVGRILVVVEELRQRPRRSSMGGTP